MRRRYSSIYLCRMPLASGDQLFLHVYCFRPRLKVFFLPCLRCVLWLAELLYLMSEDVLVPIILCNSSNHRVLRNKESRSHSQIPYRQEAVMNSSVLLKCREMRGTKT